MPTAASAGGKALEQQAIECPPLHSTGGPELSYIPSPSSRKPSPLHQLAMHQEEAKEGRPQLGPKKESFERELDVIHLRSCKERKESKKGRLRASR